MSDSKCGHYRIMRLYLPFAAAMAALAIPAGLTATKANSLPADNEKLALTGAKIYPSPSEPPIADGVVVVRGAKIAAVGKSGSVAIPADAKVLDCKGLIVAAGFQNSHVHFTEAKWDNAASQPAAQLGQDLSDMLTRYGFTTVVDLASSLPNTTALRVRIQSGEIPGPRILTAGGGVYPPKGTPFYLRDTLPPAVLEYLEAVEEPATPDAARKLVLAEINGGADVVKLFVGALLSPTEVRVMPPEIAAAAVAEAHRHGRMVFAHPSNLEGLEVALEGGVDVLAHTTPMSGRWDAALIPKLKEHGMSLIPTLKLWGYELHKAEAPPAAVQQYDAAAAGQLLQYRRAGGQILFGTDVGYMTDYDPSEEYALMSQAGLTGMQILDSLTTAPAARFGESASRGQVAPGMDADIVVLAADPARDARNFASVRYTIRRGRVIYPVPSN
ncbi:MAG TPA: amidohydrolase family protein [Candidatus Acidoferrales bacterium]|nr:amidohydrolase family protein [Candidatus Acidoferrales bacterium]